MNRRRWAVVAAGCACLVFTSLAQAAPPWASLMSLRKKIEADPEKLYELTDANGPWVILAATFTSTDAEQEAHELVLELRREYGLAAYVHAQDYDFTQTVEGRGIDEYGNPKRMRYANAQRFTGVAVLVGDFESHDDPAGQRALDTIKSAMPKSLDVESSKWTLQRWKVMREIRRLAGTSSDQNKGPLGNAFITKNPLIPEEFFDAGGLDGFVVKLNDGLEYSLLQNRGRYTVRVATFGGENTMDPDRIDELSSSRTASDKLEQAADDAHRMTLALRKKGVEAFEFHDRYNSIVTIGGFDEYEQATPDGMRALRTDIREIIARYGADRANLPGAFGVVRKKIAGVQFDVQPQVIEVPRKSFGSAYARTAR